MTPVKVLGFKSNLYLPKWKNTIRGLAFSLGKEGCKDYLKPLLNNLF
jgi:hypothetical protein